MIGRSVLGRTAALGLTFGVAVALGPGAALASSHAHPARPTVRSAAGHTRSCLPSATAVGYSDGLNKLVRNGVELGGLSSLAYDRRSHAWVSAVDNHGTDPARLWFFRTLADPRVVRDPLILRAPDGTPYNGTNSDNEGLAVLPDGDYLVSSETEPSIRIYGRDGVQKAALPIPARFAVTGTTPAGQATSNATLEGLTMSPSGTEVIAAMEGALSGDVSPLGDTTYHRFLVYDRAPGGSWGLSKQIGYRTEPGMRVPEVAAVSPDGVLVEEAAYSSVTGNSVSLFSVTGLSGATDVSAVENLSAAPAGDVVTKKLVVNVLTCPTLGAPARETQTNPLLDNFEGMAARATGRPGVLAVSLISDDNFSPDQTTRILNLRATIG